MFSAAWCPTCWHVSMLRFLIRLPTRISLPTRLGLVPTSPPCPTQPSSLTPLPLSSRSMAAALTAASVDAGSRALSPQRLRRDSGRGKVGRPPFWDACARREVAPSWELCVHTHETFCPKHELLPTLDSRAQALLRGPHAGA